MFLTVYYVQGIYIPSSLKCSKLSNAINVLLDCPHGCFAIYRWQCSVVAESWENWIRRLIGLLSCYYGCWEDSIFGFSIEREMCCVWWWWGANEGWRHAIPPPPPGRSPSLPLTYPLIPLHQFFPIKYLAGRKAIYVVFLPLFLPLEEITSSYWFPAPENSSNNRETEQIILQNRETDKQYCRTGKQNI